MVDEKGLRVRVIEQISIVVRQIFNLRVHGLDIDPGVVPGTSQYVLDAEHLVTDGVAIAQRREDLVSLGPTTGLDRHYGCPPARYGSGARRR